MTRETKIGLLIGVGLILLVSVIVCDYLAQVQDQVPADFSRLFERDPQQATASRNEGSNTSGHQIPTPVELEQQRPASPQRIQERTTPAEATQPLRSAESTEVVAAEIPSRGGQIIHYVKQGETLYSIAFRYYGNGEYWRSLAQANPNVDDAGAVSVGQRLIIPNHASWIDDANAALALHEDDAPAVRTNGNSQPTLSRVANRPQEITVKRGDTLSGLAAKHLGSARRWEELFEANRDQLDKPEDLRVGMKLKIPDANNASQRDVSNGATQANGNRRTSRPTLSRLFRRDSSDQANTDEQDEDARILEGAQAYARATENVMESKTYRVQSGDTLAKIAQRELGSSDRWREIYEANQHRLEDPNAVQVGQVLTLPTR